MDVAKQNHLAAWIFSSEVIPSYILEHAIRSKRFYPSTSENALKNPNLNENFMLSLIAEKADWIMLRLSANPKLTDRVISSLYEYALNNKDNFVVHNIINHGRLSEEIVNSIAKHGTADQQVSMAYHEFCERNVSEKILKMTNAKYLKCIAFDKNTPTERLVQMARDNTKRKDGKLALQEKIARNPNTPVELLRIYSRSSDLPSNCSAASNRSTDPLSLERLFAKGNSSICRELASNKNIDKSLLLKVFNEGEYLTKSAIASKAEISRELFDRIMGYQEKDPGIPMRMYMMYNDSVGKDWIEELYQSIKHSVVRSMMGRCTRLSHDSLKEIYELDGENDPAIRCMIILNESFIPKSKSAVLVKELYDKYLQSFNLPEWKL